MSDEVPAERGEAGRGIHLHALRVFDCYLSAYDRSATNLGLRV